MSNPRLFDDLGRTTAMSTFGGTITSGIQDISALLPLIGTEQCEKHIGSALEGGYIYAAAGVLSIFGSLGIVKAGVYVLIASISVQKPSISFTPLPKLTFTSGHRWLGAKFLKNSGFELTGSVASQIGIDTGGNLSLRSPSARHQPESQRYTAETSVLENLEEKHIDDPERLSIKWKSAGWNAGLIFSIFIAALMSGTPYVHLIAKGDVGRLLHSPWVFPFLRAIGSSFIAISIQFILQYRIISLVNNRIIFMIVDRKHSEVIKKIPEGENVKWDGNLPADECLSSLRHYLQTYRAQNGSSDCSS